MSEKIDKHQHELAKLIKRDTDRDGVHATSSPSLFFIHESTITEPISRVDEPSFCIIVQGEKEVWLGEEHFRFGLGKYIVTAVDLPVTGQVIKASIDSPYLALKLQFTPSEILDTDIQAVQKKSTKRAMFISEVEPSLLDVVVRLACLLDNPKHIPILAPLFK